MSPAPPPCPACWGAAAAAPAVCCAIRCTCVPLPAPGCGASPQQHPFAPTKPPLATHHTASLTTSTSPHCSWDDTSAQAEPAGELCFDDAGRLLEDSGSDEGADEEALAGSRCRKHLRDYRLG